MATNKPEIEEITVSELLRRAKMTTQDLKESVTPIINSESYKSRLNSFPSYDLHRQVLNQLETIMDKAPSNRKSFKP